jgi:SepF-like predicted cell division protein (DUF552 family)
MTPQEKKKMWLNGIVQLIGGVILILTTYALTNKSNQNAKLDEANKTEITTNVLDKIKPDLNAKLDKTTFDEHEIQNEKDILAIKEQVKNNNEQLILLITQMSSEQRANNSNVMKQIELMFKQQSDMSKRVDDIYIKIVK